MNAPARPLKPSLDELYRDVPDTRPQYLWPVIGRKGWGIGAIAWFDSHRKAAEFVNAEIGKRTLFIGKPQEAE